MITETKIERMIGVLLLLGTMTSALLVLVGGIWYLSLHGGEDMQTEMLASDAYSVKISQIWHILFALTPLSLIELGLIALVTTQLLRVALLVWFYANQRDYRFTGISLFILLTLLYSFIWQK